MLDRRAQPGASRALARRHDLTEQRTPHLTYLADAVARRTLRGVRTRQAAGAAARIALHRHLHLDRAPRAEHDLGERELHHRLGIGPAARSTRRRAAAEHVAAEERVEEVVETETAGPERVRVGCRVGPEHVVLPPPFRVAHQVVRRVDRLEPLRRVRIVGVRVRMALARELSVRTLDLVVGRLRRDAEHLVRVVSHQRYTTLMRLRPPALRAARTL